MGSRRLLARALAALAGVAALPASTRLAGPPAPSPPVLATGGNATRQATLARRARLAMGRAQQSPRGQAEKAYQTDCAGACAQEPRWRRGKYRWCAACQSTRFLEALEALAGASPALQSFRAQPQRAAPPAADRCADGLRLRWRAGCFGWAVAPPGRHPRSRALGRRGAAAAPRSAGATRQPARRAELGSEPPRVSLEPVVRKRSASRGCSRFHAARGIANPRRRYGVRNPSQMSSERSNGEQVRRMSPLAGVPPGTH